MRHFFLVDYENVKEKGLEGFFSLKRKDTVYVFYSVNQQKISMEFIQTLRKGFFNPKIEYVYVKAGKQSLDMQLSSFLGYLISENGTFACDYTIVSSDRDFLHVLDFWNDRMGKTVVFEYPTIDRYLKKDTVALLSAPKEEEKKEASSSARSTSSSRGTVSSSRTRSSSRTGTAARQGRNVSQPQARNSGLSQQKKGRELERAANEADELKRSSSRSGERARSASALPVKVSPEEVSLRSREAEKKASPGTVGSATVSARPVQRASSAGRGQQKPVRRDEDLLREEPVQDEAKEASAMVEGLKEEPVKEVPAGPDSPMEDTAVTTEETGEEEAPLTQAAETPSAAAAEEDTKDGEAASSADKDDEAGEPVKKSAPKKKAPAAKSTSAAKASAKKKEEAHPETAQGDEAASSRQAQSEKTMLNNRLQQVLAKAQVDTKVISEITHLVLEHMDEKNFRQVVYREMIKKYRQADGLEYYRIIKNVI